MDATSQTIPSWLIAAIMVYTGFIWLMSRKKNIHIDARIPAHTLILWGLLYVVFQQFPIDIEVRGFIARLMILLLCISQALPLTVSYLRSFRNDKYK